MTIFRPLQIEFHACADSELSCRSVVGRTRHCLPFVVPYDTGVADRGGAHHKHISVGQADMVLAATVDWLAWLVGIACWHHWYLAAIIHNALDV